MFLSHSRRLAVVVSLSLAAGCRRGPRVEEAPAIPVTTPSAAPTTLATALGPPQAADVQAKLDQVFHGAVRAVGTAGSFAAGDFSRDGLTDLAALAEVNPERLGDVNDDLAAWIVQDAMVGPQAPHTGAVPPRPRLAASERVLVVINAFDQAGWRNPDARQTYVVKGVTTGPLGATPIAAVVDRTTRPLGPPFGDVLEAQAEARQGFISYVNGRYSWAPFETKVAVARAKANAKAAPPVPPHAR